MCPPAGWLNSTYVFALHAYNTDNLEAIVKEFFNVFSKITYEKDYKKLPYQYFELYTINHSSIVKSNNVLNNVITDMIHYYKARIVNRKFYMGDVSDWDSKENNLGKEPRGLLSILRNGLER
jgi:hypothetical protein